MNTQLTNLERNYDAYQSEFLTLRPEKQDEALIGAFRAVRGCLPETKEVYRYITKMCDGNRDEFSIPAMLIPAMLGMKYTEPYNQRDFVRGFLREHGTAGQDWMFKKKSEIFNMRIESQVEFQVPGRENESIIISKSASNNAKWPFVTPKFARWLLTHTTKPISRQLIDFYLEVHDAARNLKQALDSGEITLIRKELSGAEIIDRPFKRLKTAERSASLMGMEIDTVDGTGTTLVSNRYLGPRVHDQLNLAFCGHTRNQIAEGLNHRGANVSDHDTLLQQMWKATMKYTLRTQILQKQANNEKVDARFVLQQNQENIRSAANLLPMIRNEGIITEALTVEQARQAIREK